MTDTVPWIEEAKRVLGVKEIPGPQSNKTILDWAKAIGGYVAQFYRNDDIPWCGLFVGHCIQASGMKPPPDMLAAIGWSKWGVKQSEPTYGSIVVFRWKSGRHHVGFAVGQDSKTIHTLGGNQANSVNVTKFPLSSCIAFRFPICDLKPQPLPMA